MKRLVMTVVVACALLQAMPADAMRRRFCETWRDYEYFSETGEFYRWTSAPYEVCWETEDWPPPLPSSDGWRERGDRRGVPGRAHPKASADASCNRCNNELDQAVADVPPDFASCIGWAETLSSEICQAVSIPKWIHEGWETICYRDDLNKPHCGRHETMGINPRWDRCMDQQMVGTSDGSRESQTIGGELEERVGGTGGKVRVAWQDMEIQTTQTSGDGLQKACEQARNTVAARAWFDFSTCSDAVEAAADSNGLEDYQCRQK